MVTPALGTRMVEDEDLKSVWGKETDPVEEREGNRNGEEERKEGGLCFQFFSNSQQYY